MCQSKDTYCTSPERSSSSPDAAARRHPLRGTGNNSGVGDVDYKDIIMIFTSDLTWIILLPILGALAVLATPKNKKE